MLQVTQLAGEECGLRPMLSSTLPRIWELGSWLCPACSRLDFADSRKTPEAGHPEAWCAWGVSSPQQSCLSEILP